jgi:hypothetical protein
MIDDVVRSEGGRTCFNINGLPSSLSDKVHFGPKSAFEEVPH